MKKNIFLLLHFFPSDRKRFLFSLPLLFMSAFALAQQDSITMWISTGMTGNIKAVDLQNCSYRFVCATGKNFYDIAFTPDGKLWGNTKDSLYKIDTISGMTNLVGHIQISNSLVGLNDSTLFIESEGNLYALKNTDASTQLIGHIGYSGDGDLAWLGKDLYMYGNGYLIRIILDSAYSHVLGVDTLRNAANPYTYATYGLAGLYLAGFGYSIVGLPGNSEVYRLDTINASYNLLCTTTGVDTSYGASSMIFPPTPKQPLSINNVNKINSQFSIYPNPVLKYLNIENLNYHSIPEDIELLLHDFTGRLIARKKMNGQKEIFDMNLYTHGMYYLEIVKKKKETVYMKIEKR